MIRGLKKDCIKAKEMIRHLIIKDEEKNNEQQSKPQNQDQKAQDNDEKQEEMSIESGIPDLDNETKVSDSAEEEIKIENSSRPDLKKRKKSSEKFIFLRSMFYL